MAANSKIHNWREIQTCSRLGDLEKAKEMLLNAKVELQGKLEGAERNFQGCQICFMEMVFWNFYLKKSLFIKFNNLATLGQTAAKEALRRQEENAAKLSEAASEREKLKKEMVSSSFSISMLV